MNIKEMIFGKKKKAQKRWKLEMNVFNVAIVSVSIAILMFSANTIYLSEDVQTFTLMNLVIAMVAIGVPFTYRYSRYKKFRRLEALFPRFLSDITDSVNTGMTVTQAIRTASRNDYGEFNPYAKEMAAKISWGIPLSTVLEDFAKKVQSPGIKRTVQTINAAHKSGGTIQTVLEAVSETTQELDKIRKERSASVYSQMINGYLIFFIFLGVMVGISSFLIPAFGVDDTNTELVNLLPEMFRDLVVIQGVFAGMAVGKMAEGTFLAGAKHSMAFSVIGYTVFILFG